MTGDPPRCTECGDPLGDDDERYGTARHGLCRTCGLEAGPSGRQPLVPTKALLAADLSETRALLRAAHARTADVAAEADRYQVALAAMRTERDAAQEERDAARALNQEARGVMGAALARISGLCGQGPAWSSPGQVVERVRTALDALTAGGPRAASGETRLLSRPVPLCPVCNEIVTEAALATYVHGAEPRVIHRLCDRAQVPEGREAEAFLAGFRQGADAARGGDDG